MSVFNQRTLYIIFQLVFTGGFLGLTVELKHSDIGVIGSFIPIGVISIYHIAHSWAQDGYSIRLIFWFFTYWFAFLVPLASYMTGNWWYGDMSVINQGLIVYANVCILVFSCIYLCTYSVGSLKPVLPALWKRHLVGFTISRNWSLISSMAMLGLTAFLGVVLREDLFVRTIDVGSERAAMQRPVYLLLLFILRPMVVFAFLHALSKWLHEREISWVALVVVSLCLLVSNFPPALARYYSFGIIFGIAAVVLLRDAAIKVASTVLLWGGTFIAVLLHPLRYIGTHYGSFGDLMDAYKQTQLSEYFFEGHYAAYEIFVMGLQMIEDKGLAGGRQLLGTLTSWIPRSIWLDKPEHTGKLILENSIYRVSNSQFDNISAPVYLESMVDFGWFGLVVFAVILGYVSARFDVLLKEVRTELRKDRNESTAVFSILYTILVPVPALTFLFWRGSWMPAFGYLAGTCIAGVVYLAVVARRRAGRAGF